MKWCIIGIVLAGVVGIFNSTAQATVIDFGYHIWAYNPFEATHTVSFDYDLQHLTIAETIHELDFKGYISFGTSVDSASTFSVVKTLVNNTGITWTDYSFSWGGPLIAGSPAMIDRESVKSTQLQTISYLGDWTMELSGSPVVLDGESLTIEFSLHTSGGSDVYYNKFHQSVVPEPATMLLLGLGGLALLRNSKIKMKKSKSQCKM